MNKRVFYIVLWHVGFMLLYFLGALLMSGAKDFNHLNIHWLNLCALCTIMMVLGYQFYYAYLFFKKQHHNLKTLVVNYLLIEIIYFLYLLFYVWLFVDYLQNREEHLYFGLRDMQHLFEVKESILHVGFFSLMVYSSIFYFLNFYLVYAQIRKIESHSYRKAYYKVFYNPIILGLIFASIVGVIGYFVLHMQGLVL